MAASGSDRRLLVFALALALLAGFVDALGFLAGSAYFVSFMSGNSTLFAIDVAQGAAKGWAILLVIGGFTAGVVLGTVVGERSARLPHVALLFMVGGLLAAAALAMPRSTDLALGAMVLAMGAVNVALANHGGGRVGFTYMTGALVRTGIIIGQTILGMRPRWTPDILFWFMLVGGAMLGALAHGRFGEDGAAWIAAGGALLLAGLAMPLGRTTQAG